MSMRPTCDWRTEDTAVLVACGNPAAVFATTHVYYGALQYILPKFPIYSCGVSMDAHLCAAHIRTLLEETNIKP